MAIAPVANNNVANTTAAAGPTDAELRQQAVNDALGQLQGMSSIPRPDGSSWDANQYFGPGVIDGWKAPFADNIRAMADSDMTPDQVREAAAGELQGFGMRVEFMRAVRNFIFMQFVNGMQEMNADAGLNDWQQSPT